MHVVEQYKQGGFPSSNLQKCESGLVRDQREHDDVRISDAEHRPQSRRRRSRERVKPGENRSQQLMQSAEPQLGFELRPRRPEHSGTRRPSQLRAQLQKPCLSHTRLPEQQARTTTRERALKKRPEYHPFGLASHERLRFTDGTHLQDHYLVPRGAAPGEVLRRRRPLTHHSPSGGATTGPKCTATRASLT